MRPYNNFHWSSRTLLPYGLAQVLEINQRITLFCILEDECAPNPRIRSLSGSQGVYPGTPPQGEDGKQSYSSIIVR